VSVGFLIYGINLYCSTTSANQAITPFEGTNEINKYLFVMLAFTLCFSLRIAMFLYRPITDHYMNDNLFPVLAYYLPEVVPSILELCLIHTPKIKQHQIDKNTEEFDSERSVLIGANKLS